jgi:hypothetical protein
MKKLIVIAAVAALGLGAAAPAAALQSDGEFKQYVALNRINRSGIARPQWCQNNQKQLELLISAQNKGEYFYWGGKHDNGRKHRETITMHRDNSDLCVSKGYMSRPRTAPVAQRQPSYSDLIDNYFEEAARQTGIPVSLLMGPGAAVPGQSNEQRKRSCENAGSRWIERGPSGWPVCDHSRGASHSRDLPGLPVNR